MVTIVKHEWHQHDRQYAIELDEALLSEIYPDLDEDEIVQKLTDIQSGEVDFEEVINDAYENDVEIEWDFQYDDCWTDRKGGYEVTYELGDESSWHHEPEPDPPTHKCTKCKWKGQSYDAEWHWPEDDNEDAKQVCPYCESDIELTEFGIQKEKESAERSARWAKEAADEEEYVPCFSCGAMHKESELPEIKESGYYCPDCNEGWVMMDSREEEPVDEADLEADLEELKREFEQLPVDNPSTHWPTPDSDFVETAKWPFENDEDDGSMKESYPEDTYTIRVWGRTREIGVHKIKKAQYEHWSSEEHEGDLSDALNENYDYDDNETPKAARFDLPYYEYQDKISFWGFDQDDTHMTIENSEGETIYDGDLESFFGEAHGDEDSLYDATEEQEELYPEHLGKGYWLMWTQGGKGSCIQTTIEGVFEPKKLKVFNWDIQGTSVVTRLVYDGVELDDEGMDSEHDNWRGQWAQFDVYHNTK
jgi:DNA-directed RNA polymerase subunit RPC12/RpoP